MRSLLISLLTASVLATALTVAAAEAEPEDPRADGKWVAIPEAGISMTLPGTWRIESERQRFRGQLLMANNLERREDCHVALTEHATVGKAAEDYLDGPQGAELARTDLELPIGEAVRLVSPNPDVGLALHVYFVDTPAGVTGVTCFIELHPWTETDDLPPVDYRLPLVESIEPLAADHAPAATFDPRIEARALGLAIEFPAGWLVKGPAGGGAAFVGDEGPDLLGHRILDQLSPSDARCGLENHSGEQWIADVQSLEDWLGAVVEAVAVWRPDGPPMVSEFDLGAGRALRADWPGGGSPYRKPLSVWAFAEADRYVLLWCDAVEPPNDNWLSIAATLEFLSPQAER